MCNRFSIKLIVIDCFSWLYKHLKTSRVSSIQDSILKLHLSKNGLRSKFAQLSILSHFFLKLSISIDRVNYTLSQMLSIHMRILDMWKRRNPPLNYFPQNSHKSITLVECAEGGPILSLIFNIFTQAHLKHSTKSFHHFHFPHITHSIHGVEWHDLVPFLHSHT